MTGTLYGIGLGPGDPDLITLKALKVLQSCHVVAYPQPDNGPSFARSIAAPHLSAAQLEIPIIVPMDVKRHPAKAVYDVAAETISHHLDAGSDVVVLCEGDPFFYGSFMYLHERLAGRYPVEVVPGVSSIMASAAAIARPVAARNDVLTIIPAPLDDERVKAQIENSDAVAIIKLGRHLPRIRALIERLGLTGHSAFVERVTLDNEKLLPLKDAPAEAPYFSMILIYKGAEEWVLSLSAAGQT